jgi:Mn2+/Fe2+ NRAMP family transporter
MFNALKKFLRILGPGIITGASDDDPSGIATYSQTGAQFGYGQLWTALYLLPLLVGVQEACTRIGVVTGKGIATVVREHFSKPVLYVVSTVAQMLDNLGQQRSCRPGSVRLASVPLRCRRACSGPRDWIGN